MPDPTSDKSKKKYEPPKVTPINFKLSPGMNAACHLCRPSKEFKTIEELQQHVLDDHRVYKG